MEKLDKRVGAWVIMDIYSMETINSVLTRLIGPIVDSNFLEVSEQSEWPVLSSVFEDVDFGSRVKLIYFTTKKELDSFKARESIGFEDNGEKYLIWRDDAWELLYDG